VLERISQSGLAQLKSVYFWGCAELMSCTQEQSDMVRLTCLSPNIQNELAAVGFVVTGVALEIGCSCPCVVPSLAVFKVQFNP
jgi:hypothetical protein